MIKITQKQINTQADMGNITYNEIENIIKTHDLKKKTNLSDVFDYITRYFIEEEEYKINSKEFNILKERYDTTT